MAPRDLSTPSKGSQPTLGLEKGSQSTLGLEKQRETFSGSGIYGKFRTQVSELIRIFFGGGGEKFQRTGQKSRLLSSHPSPLGY